MVDGKVCEKCGSVEPDTAATFCGFCGDKFPSREESNTTGIVISKELAHVLVQGKKDADDLKAILEEKFNTPVKDAKKQVISAELGDGAEQTDESLAVWKELSGEMQKKKRINSAINDLFDF